MQPGTRWCACPPTTQFSWRKQTIRFNSRASAHSFPTSARRQPFMGRLHPGHWRRCPQHLAASPSTRASRSVSLPLAQRLTHQSAVVFRKSLARRPSPAPQRPAQAQCLHAGPSRITGAQGQASKPRPSIARHMQVCKVLHAHPRPTPGSRRARRGRHPNPQQLDPAKLHQGWQAPPRPASRPTHAALGLP